MTTEQPANQPSLRVPGVRAGLLTCLVLAVAAAGSAGLSQGRPQVVGALVGVALVAGFFLFGALSIALVTAYAPRASMFVALSTYALQVTLLALVFVGVQRSGAAGDSLDLGWLAATVIAGTLCWVTALLVVSMKGVRG